MGISLYQQFSLQEASLFLRCPLTELQDLINQREIQFIQVSKNETHFFGFQLLQHLLNNVVDHIPNSSPKQTTDSQDRILRTQEVQKIVGVSRSTIWRMEQKGDFPNRVPLGTGSVGWLKSDVEGWVRKTIIST